MKRLLRSITAALLLCTGAQVLGQAPTPLYTPSPPPGQTPASPAHVDYVPGYSDEPSIPSDYLGYPIYTLDEICASYVAELLAAKDSLYQAAQAQGASNRQDKDRCDKPNHYLARYTIGSRVLYLSCPAPTDRTANATYSVIEQKGAAPIAQKTVIEFADAIPKKLELVHAMPYRLAPECIRQRDAPKQGNAPPGRGKP